MAQLSLSQNLHKVSATFRLPRHQVLCIYKNRLVNMEAVVLTPAQGFKLEAVQDDVIGEESIIWLFYNKPYYFVWLGPTACLIPILRLRQVIGGADDNDEFKLRQWHKSHPKLQRCKQATNQCECNPLAKEQNANTTEIVMMEDSKDTNHTNVSIAPPPSASSPSSSISVTMSCSPSVDDIPLSDRQFMAELYQFNACASCGAVGGVHVRGCHVWAMRCGDTSDIFPAYSCDMFMSKKSCQACDEYALRHHMADSFIL